MFCKKCGNQIADNAKFCNRCGEPCAGSPGDKEPFSPVQDAARYAENSSPAAATGTSDDFFQKEQPVYKPYEPVYPQPAGQPYPAPASVNAGTGTGGMGKHIVPSVILFVLSLFMISSPFLKLFGDSRFSFSPFSYLNDLSKVSGKNIFSLSIDSISNGKSDTVFFFLSLWVNIIFEVCALIFVLIAFIGLFSKKQNKAVKVLGNLRVSIGLSLLGFLISFGLMIASYMKYGEFSGIFKEVFYIFSYVCLGVAVLSMILAVVFVGNAKKEDAVNNSYQQPYSRPVPPPYQPPYGN